MSRPFALTTLLLLAAVIELLKKGNHAEALKGAREFVKSCDTAAPGGSPPRARRVMTANGCCGVDGRGASDRGCHSEGS